MNQLRNHMDKRLWCYCFIFCVSSILIGRTSNSWVPSSSLHLNFIDSTNLQIPSNALNTFESLQFVNKPNGMIGAMDNTDSLKKNSISVSIKAGRPMTIFLNNYSQNNNFTSGLFKPFSEYTPPFTFGFEIINGSKYIMALNYQYFDKTNSSKDRIQGDVVYRFYHVVMTEVGKMIKYNNFSLTPTINLNYKLSGTEAVLVGYIPVGFKEAIIQTFQYKSLGIGLGGAIKYCFLSNFYISTDVRFTHNFEKSKPYRKLYGGVDEFYNSYRVNRDVFTLSLNIGYQFNMGN